MNPIKILNLYACLGGNRYKWDEVADIEVTAVELDPELARLYSERFPNDNVVIADAHQYLLDHYKEFDFIWSSPPCPSHSRARFWNASNYDNNTEPVYPDMKLYQEIIFLQNYYKGHWVVENVIPYYDPLVPASKRGRHLFWSSVKIPYNTNERGGAFHKIKDDVGQMCDFHEIDLSTYKGKQRKDKIARNLVDYEVGKAIFQRAVDVMQGNEVRLGSLFESLKKQTA